MVSEVCFVKCKFCGKHIPDHSRYCQYCGSNIQANVNWTPGGVQGEPQDLAREEPRNASYSVVCPECGSSNIRFNSVSESKPVGLFAWILILLGALCFQFVVFLVLLLVFLLARKSTKTVTYGTCQRCGHRWKKPRYEL